MSWRILTIGAGTVGRRGTLPALLELRQHGAVETAVFDHAVLRPDHLDHPTYAGCGEPGLPKAAALALGLRDAGIAATALHGDVLRWPGSVLRGDLAVVGLDDESARAAVDALLRKAGTPALVVGITDVVAVHAFSANADAPCYRCSAPRSVPLQPVPCGGSRGPTLSTREHAGAAALRVLADRLPALVRAALDGRELDTYHLFTPVAATGGAGSDPTACTHLRARLHRNPGCVGDHAAPPTPSAHLGVDCGTRVAALFDRLGAGAELRGCRVRGDYLCRQCGRSGQRGRDLVRAWPRRERCACGSEAVRPLLQLRALTSDDAERHDLAAERLLDLGVLPGSAFEARLADGRVVAIDVSGCAERVTGCAEQVSRCAERAPTTPRRRTPARAVRGDRAFAPRPDPEETAS